MCIYADEENANSRSGSVSFLSFFFFQKAEPLGSTNIFSLPFLLEEVESRAPFQNGAPNQTRNKSHRLFVSRPVTSSLQRVGSGVSSAWDSANSQRSPRRFRGPHQDFVSSLPSSFEKVVSRCLRPSSSLDSRTELAPTMRRWAEILRRKNWQRDYPGVLKHILFSIACGKEFLGGFPSMELPSYRSLRVSLEISAEVL